MREISFILSAALKFENIFFELAQNYMLMRCAINLPSPCCITFTLHQLRKRSCKILGCKRNCFNRAWTFAKAGQEKFLTMQTPTIASKFADSIVLLIEGDRALIFKTLFSPRRQERAEVR